MLHCALKLVQLDEIQPGTIAFHPPYVPDTHLDEAVEAQLSQLHVLSQQILERRPDVVRAILHCNHRFYC